jgi:hypothetical protein
MFKKKQTAPSRGYKHMPLPLGRRPVGADNWMVV